MPADAGFFDVATHVTKAEVEVAGTVEEVWAVLNDHPSWTEWFPGMSSVTAQPNVWTAAGDTRQVKVNFLPVSEQAIIVEPNVDLAFTILKWPLPIAKRAAERMQLVDTSRNGESYVNVIYTGAFELRMNGRISWPLMKGQLASAWAKAFENLPDAIAKRS